MTELIIIMDNIGFKIDGTPIILKQLKNQSGWEIKHGEIIETFTILIEALDYAGNLIFKQGE